MFKIARRDVADLEPFIHNLSGTEGKTYELGEALKLVNGTLTKAAGADMPTHICMGTVNDMGYVPVISVVKTTHFETEASAAVAETLVGTAVTLDADGLRVTATAGGAFVIDETDGDKLVVGHFA